MFTKTMSNTKIALSIAIILGTASAALAETPSKYLRHTFSPAATARAMVPSNQVRHSSNPNFDVYDSRGEYIGSDPDPRVRMDILRDEDSGF
jgi:hypothetical protein